MNERGVREDLIFKLPSTFLKVEPFPLLVDVRLEKSEIKVFFFFFFLKKQVLKLLIHLKFQLPLQFIPQPPSSNVVGIKRKTAVRLKLLV